MSKKSKNNKSFSKVKSNKKIIIIVLAVVLVLLGVARAAWQINNYRLITNQASTEPIRELILSAARGLNKDAPVDFRTGDVYFPESRLYVPNPRTMQAVTYRDDNGLVDSNSSELHVSTSPLYGTTDLYSATSLNELFKNVPKFQACARGVNIVANPLKDSDSSVELIYTAQLSNGQSRYIYLEKACPELKPLAESLKNIKAY